MHHTFQYLTVLQQLVSGAEKGVSRGGVIQMSFLTLLIFHKWGFWSPKFLYSSLAGVSFSVGVNTVTRLHGHL